jgi:hypothetical protein
VTQDPKGEPVFNMGRWLLWGLIAIVALAVVVIIINNYAEDIEAEATTVPTLIPGGGDQVEWTIQTSEYTPAPGEVTLKGDTPLGFPTETWKDGFQLARSVGESFEWNMEVDPEVPMPVYEIDQAGSCEELNEILLEWANAVSTAAGEARRAEASAFAQHAANTMNEQGCEISVDQ